MQNNNTALFPATKVGEGVASFPASSAWARKPGNEARERGREGGEEGERRGR